MSSLITKRLIATFALLSLIGWAGRAHAQISIGTWVRTDDQGEGISMTVEVCCNGGRRLIYHVPMPGQAPMMLTVDSPMDGSEVPALVGGKPSGETMAITRVDERHYKAVMKMGGNPFRTSNATLSPDGKTLTVESISHAGKWWSRRGFGSNRTSLDIFGLRL